jgi:hypothetical protein
MPNIYKLPKRDDQIGHACEIIYHVFDACGFNADERLDVLAHAAGVVLATPGTLLPAVDAYESEKLTTLRADFFKRVEAEARDCGFSESEVV